MKSNPLFLAVRAISAEFAQRIYLPIVLIVSGALIILIGLLTWGVTVSAWWWIAFVPIIFFALLFALASVIAWFVIQLLKPRQTSSQKKEVRGLVDAIQKSSETIQTPKFIILFRLVKDMVVPGKDTLISELSSTATSLRTHFKAIIESFR